VKVLAGLLAEVVERAAEHAVYPGHLTHTADRAMEPSASAARYPNWAWEQQ
jgi:hypothetical protein